MNVEANGRSYGNRPHDRLQQTRSQSRPVVRFLFLWSGFTKAMCPSTAIGVGILDTFVDAQIQRQVSGTDGSRVLVAARRNAPSLLDKLSPFNPQRYPTINNFRTIPCGIRRAFYMRRSRTVIRDVLKNLGKEMMGLVIITLAFALPKIAQGTHVDRLFRPVMSSSLENLKAAMDAITPKRYRIVATPREFPTSTPGVSYVLKPDGTVEFRVPPDFQGTAITPDGRNLFIAN